MTRYDAAIWDGDDLLVVFRRTEGDLPELAILGDDREKAVRRLVLMADALRRVAEGVDK